MRFAASIAILLCGAWPALAGPMVHHIEAVGPRCGSRGTTVEVTLHGVSLEQAREIIFYRPGIRAIELEDLPPYERPISLHHSGRIEEQVRCKFVIAADCPIGEHPFRLRTATELTGLSMFAVTKFPTVDEAETRRGDNDSLAKAKPVSMNVTVRGKMDSDRMPDVDLYRVSGKSGEHLSVEVDSVWLTEKHYAELEFDLMVRLLDDRGRELARNDDSALHVQDPIVSAILPRDGDYIVEVRQPIYRTGSFVYYAAHIGNHRRPLAVYPAGGQPGQTLSATLLGDPAGELPLKIGLPPTLGDFAYEGDMPSTLPMRVSAFPNVLEVRDSEETSVASLPAALNGIIESPGDADVFQLSAKKGARYRVRVFARSLGTPLDPRIWIERVGGDSPEVEGDDATYPDRGLYAVGPQLQRKELLDPSVVWQAQHSGTYRLGISDMRSLGGPTFVYRIEIEPASDAVFTYPYSRVIDNVECPRLTSFAIAQGNRWTVNIGLSEGQGNQYRGELEMIARGLPPGVRMIAPRVPAGYKTIPVQFVASADARPQVALFEVLARPADPAQKLISGSQQAFPFLGHSGGHAWRSVVVDRYALAVTEQAPFSIEVVPPAIPLALNGELTLDVIIKRRPGFNAPVEFQADWVPNGVDVQPTVTAEAGQNKAQYRLSAGAAAKPGKWKIALEATTTGGSYYLGVGRIRVSSAFVDVTIAEPYLALKNHPASIRRGQRGQVIWDVDHKKPLAGETEAVLLGLPKGVSVVEPAPRLKAGDKQLVFNIVASDDVLLGQYKELKCEIVVREAGQEIRQRTGTGILRVDPPLASKPREAKR
ncbi:MAG TPA: serine protease [Pirellulales bacterium]|nr:serine protease [Pirellulales bacterium]